MKGIDLIVAVLAIALVAGSIWLAIRRGKRGESGCVGCEACKRKEKDKACY